MAFTPNDFRQRRQFGAPELDMTPDGSFRRPPSIPFGTKVIAVAALVAIVAGALALAAFLLWAAVLLIPIAIVAAAIAYLVFRVQLWRGRNGRTTIMVWRR